MSTILSPVSGMPRRALLRAGNASETHDVKLSGVLKRVLEIGVLCNDAVLTRNEEDYVSMIGDPTEGAMLTVAEKGGISVSGLREARPVIWELPFDSERKMMTVGCLMEDSVPYSLTKGAPDRILDRCDRELTEEGIVSLSDERREVILSRNIHFAKQALRVLGFAYRTHDDESFEGGGIKHDLRRADGDDRSCETRSARRHRCMSQRGNFRCHDYG